MKTVNTILSLVTFIAWQALGLLNIAAEAAVDTLDELQHTLRVLGFGLVNVLLLPLRWLALLLAWAAGHLEHMELKTGDLWQELRGPVFPWEKKELQEKQKKG